MRAQKRGAYLDPEEIDDTKLRPPILRDICDTIFDPVCAIARNRRRWALNDIQDQKQKCRRVALRFLDVVLGMADLQNIVSSTTF